MTKSWSSRRPGCGASPHHEAFDHNDEPLHDRFERVIHLGTFNASPLAAAAGIVVLKQVATGEPIRRANEMAQNIRGNFDAVLERHCVAGYVYGCCSAFHVYFETDSNRIEQASSRQDLTTREASRLKGMPGKLVTEYQRHLRHHGVDLMIQREASFALPTPRKTLRTLPKPLSRPSPPCWTKS